MEGVLRGINSLLAPVESIIEVLGDGPRLPVVFIIGPPRSGTTLVSQILAATGRFGGVSNVAARFWRAPALGIRLDKAMRWISSRQTVEFTSDFGVTRGRFSPHEFGYFWGRWFDLGQETHKLSPADLNRIDWVGLQRALGAMERASGEPLAFKNNTWCTFQAGFLAELFPTSIFVVCRRDALYVAQSLLLARIERLGSPSLWWSVRPSAYREIKELPYWEQVAVQACWIEREMDRAVAAVPPHRVVDAAYERVCCRPSDVVVDIFSACFGSDFDRGPVEAVSEPFESRDAQRLPDADWTRLVAAVTEHRSGQSRPGSGESTMQEC